MPGIFISEGMSLRITDIRLTVGADGNVVDSSMKWQVALDVWPIWLDVALQHATEALEARSRLIAAVENAPNGEIEGDLQARLMKEEATAGMVAIAAAAFALDNFADSVREFAPNIDSAKREWQSAGTARHRQIAETLRRTFRVTNSGAKSLADGISQIFKFRDWAVHPSGNFREPVQHDHLDVAVEWRFVAFRASNAAHTAFAATSIISQCIRAPRTSNTKLVEWCEGKESRITPLWNRAESELGEYVT